MIPGATGISYDAGGTPTSTIRWWLRCDWRRL